MIYLTVYTDGFYEEVFHKYLEPSAKKHGIPLLAVRKPNSGLWWKNTRLKAQVIEDTLRRYQHDDVVWLDADATIHGPLPLFDEIPKHFDMAMYFLDWWKHWRGVEGECKFELVNSVFMIRNNMTNRDVIRAWNIQNEGTRVWEQAILQGLLDKFGVKIYSLPNEYCAIVDMKGGVPSYIKDPVIVQHQVSREIRKDGSLLEREEKNERPE